MADYRELLRRAVDALPENNGTSRRAVYEKAREALVTQLRAIEPPLPAREITQHRLTLEDCIRQVEQEATEALLQGLKNDTEASAPKVVTTPNVQNESARVVQPQETEEVEDETAVEEELAQAVAFEEFADEPEELEAEEPEVEEPEVEAPAKDSDAESSDDEEQVERKDGAVDTDADDAVRAQEDAAKEDHLPEGEQIQQTHTAKVDVCVAELADEEQDDVSDVEDDGTSEELGVEAEPEVEAKTEGEDAPIVVPAKADKDTSEKPAPNPVDEVIAAAQAASSAAAITPPAVALRPDAQKDVRDTPEISPALSSVREVEVDEVLTEDASINVGGDEPQATIDRAIKALDLEAEGKDATSLVSASKDPKDAPAAKADKGEKASDKLLDDLSETQIVEDEETGGNGLTVFLMLVVLLLAGAGGGAFWAWKEGFVDLNPLMAQLGMVEKTTKTATAPSVAAEQTPATNDSVPVQSNVRDVTATNATPTVSETPPQTTPVAEVRLPTETAPEVPTSETVETLPVTEVAPISETPVASTEERLVADAATEPDQPKLNVGDTSETAVEVGSRSLLIEEQITGTGGAVPFTGETVWSRDVDETGAPVIKAVVSVPARNLSVNVLFRKNSDDALPASHLFEINFSVTESFLGGGIASLPGILLKDQELAQGDPLIGASARVFDNSFFFALSAAEADLSKNVALISKRGWIDLPVVYSTGRKAIVTMEKGKEGAAIFESVLAAWAAE